MNPDEIMRRKIPCHRRVKSLNNLHTNKQTNKKIETEC